MSVIKALRNLSKMQFYKDALKIRDELTSWILHNFGAKYKVKELKIFAKQIDCKKYFDSMNHEILLKMFDDLVWDKEVMWLIDKILQGNGDGVNGVNIGSQISQNAGVIYLSPVDNYCKIVKGEKECARYMDDSYIIHHSKEHLKQLLEEIKIEYAKLGLEINEHKTQIKRIDKGFVYLKQYYILTETGKVIRRTCKKNIRKERIKLRKMAKNNVPFENAYGSYKSWRGSILKYDNYNVVKNTDKLFNELYGGQYF